MEGEGGETNEEALKMLGWNLKSKEAIEDKELLGI